MDGLKEGVVANVSCCDFDPSLLVCKEEGDVSCTSQAQADALDKAFAPLVNSAGYEIYPAFPVDTGMIEGSMTYIPGENFFSPGASAQQTEIDIDAEDVRLRNDPMQSRMNPEPAGRKLCAYPEHPHYIGGDEASADSYECR